MVENSGIPQLVVDKVNPIITFTMVNTDKSISIPESELEFSAIRSSGPGGQHVNKVSTAIQLRFDIQASSLPDWLKTRLIKLNDSRITIDGVVIIKSQDHRSQKKNRDEAVNRLNTLIQKASKRPRKRIPTIPTKTSVKRRLDRKTRHGVKKGLRKKISSKDVDH